MCNEEKKRCFCSLFNRIEEFGFIERLGCRCPLTRISSNSFARSRKLIATKWRYFSRAIYNCDSENRHFLCMGALETCNRWRDS